MRTRPLLLLAVQRSGMQSLVCLSIDRILADRSDVGGGGSERIRRRDAEGCTATRRSQEMYEQYEKEWDSGGDRATSRDRRRE